MKHHISSSNKAKSGLSEDAFLGPGAFFVRRRTCHLTPIIIQILCEEITCTALVKQRRKRIFFFRNPTREKQYMVGLVYCGLSRVIGFIGQGNFPLVLNYKK